MMKSDDNILKILFFGDLVGRPGRFAVKDFLEKNRQDYDFIIANVENASHGFGLTEKNYNELSEYGINCMTSGNHIWDKKEIFNYIDGADKLVRPFNYPENTPGFGSRIFELPNGIKIGVINVLGRVFMAPIESQWSGVKNEIIKLKEITPIIIVESEKFDDLASRKLARDVAKRIEDELDYPGQIRVTVVREFRTTEIAR